MSARMLSTGLVLLLALRSPAAGPPREAAETTRLVEVVYQVADLVMSDSGTHLGKKKQPNKTQEEQLISLISSTVRPSSWVVQGGAGTIDYFPRTMSLVVNQTPAIQEQIDGLLEALRRLQDIELSIELRFLSVSQEHLARLGLADRAVVRKLDDAQMQKLLESVQDDWVAWIAQAPLKTIFNGQTATFDFETLRWSSTPGARTLLGADTIAPPKTIEKGLRVSMRPVVSVVQPQVAPLRNNEFVTTRFFPSRPASVNLQLAVGLSPGKEPKPGQVIESNWNLKGGVTVLLSGCTWDQDLEWLLGPPVRRVRNQEVVLEGRRLVLLVTVRGHPSEAPKATKRLTPLALP